ncbi:MAG: dockerin type I repeat-containing protein [Tepidisphaeraceae bacterium]
MNRSHRLRRSSRLFLAASVVCLKFTCGAFGADDTWTSGSGTWTSTDNADWSLGHPPAAGDNAHIEDTDGTSRIVIYGYTGSAPMLSTVTVANFGVGTNALWFTISGLTLSCQNENVASADSHNGSNGVIYQSAGTNDISGSLNVGIYQGDSGFYSLQGGTLDITSSSGEEFIGYGGTMNQGAGWNVLDGANIVLDSGGSYSLSGTGTLSGASVETIGTGGLGTFTQSGGLNAQGELNVGVGTGSSGTYTISNGSVNEVENPTIINIGIQSGTGLFSQSGGTVNAGTLSVGGGVDSETSGNGTYSLSGTGTLSIWSVVFEGPNLGIHPASSGPAAGEELIGDYGPGTFIQTGGTNSLDSYSSLYLGVNTGISGYYSLSSTSSASTLTVGNSEYVGYAGTGTFIQTGGTHTVGGSLYLGANTGASGIYSLSGTGLLSVSGTENIGDSDSTQPDGSTGTFTQSSGTTNDVTGNLYLGSYTYDHGTYNLLGGTLAITGSSGAENIGNGGTATFNQSGSSVNTLAAGDSLYIASFSGTGFYSLTSAGTLTSGNNEYVGYSANGTFVQSGGTNTNTAGSAWLYLGYTSGCSGNYSLSGGKVLTSAMSVGYGFDCTGTFNQSGGSLTASSFINVADQSFSKGYYTLSNNGSLSTPFLAVGVGTDSVGSFVQTGGSAAVTNNLYVAGGSGSTGQYVLEGTGALTVSNDAYVGGNSSGAGGAGVFDLYGGATATVATTGTLTIYNTTSTQVNLADSATLSVGSLNTSGNPSLFLGNQLSTGWTSGTLSITGTAGLTIGSGQPLGSNLTLYNGEVLNVTGPLTNDSSNTFTINDTALTVNGGVFNYGTMDFTNGAYGLFQGTFVVHGIVNTDPSNVSFQNLTIESGGSFQTTAGDTITVSGNLVNNGTFSGDGNVAVAGSVTGTGSLSVGTSSGSLSTVTMAGLNTSSVTINSTGKLTLTAGGATNAVNSLVINSGGVLNLTTTKLIINYGGGSDPITTIAGYIKSGYNGGHWNGPGIMSTTAQTPTNGLYYGIGYADGEDKVVAGLTSGQIEIMYTLLGDANLDGLVNGSDFNILAANFNQSITGWDQGDFNYDGLVNAADFNALAANFNQGVSGGTSSGDIAALDAFAVANGLTLPTSSVPEPASFTVGAAFLFGVVTLRNRRASRRHS